MLEAAFSAISSICTPTPFSRARKMSVCFKQINSFKSVHLVHELALGWAKMKHQNYNRQSVDAHCTTKRAPHISQCHAMDVKNQALS